MPTSGSWVDDFEVEVTQGRTGWKVRHTVGEGKHMTEKGIQTAFTLYLGARVDEAIACQHA